MRPRIRPLVGGATILAWGEFGIREFGSPDTRIIRVFTSALSPPFPNTSTALPVPFGARGAASALLRVALQRLEAYILFKICV